MRVRKFIFRSAITAAVLIVAAAGALYVLASWKPAHYSPARLTRKQKRAAAYRFVNTVLAPVNNRLGDGKKFSLTLSEEQVNAYLASLDEIYALQPDRPGETHSGRVYRAMRKAALADLAVSFRYGVVTLMVRSKEYDKILSAGVSFEFVPAASGIRGIRVRMAGVRVGRLAIPASLVRGVIGDLIERLRDESSRPGGGAAIDDGPGLSSAQIGRLLLNVLASIDGPPLPAEQRLRKWLTVRIERIEVADGRIKLEINPLRRLGEGD